MHLHILVLVFFFINKVETQRRLRSNLCKKILDYDFSHYLQVSLPHTLAAHIYQVLAKEFDLVLYRQKSISALKFFVSFVHIELNYTVKTSKNGTTNLRG